MSGYFLKLYSVFKDIFSFFRKNLLIFSPILVLLVLAPLWVLISVSSGFREYILNIIYLFDGSVTQAQIVICTCVALAGALALYASIDFFQHRAPIKLSFPGAGYSLSHHFAKVVAPRMKYNFKNSFISVSAMAAAFVVVNISFAVFMTPYLVQAALSDAPVVETQTPQDVTDSSVMLKGQFGRSNYALTSVGFEYAKTGDQFTRVPSADGLSQLQLAADWTQDALINPRSIASDSDNNSFVFDFYRSQVMKFDKHGQLVRSWGSDGTSGSTFDNSTQVDTDDNGNVYAYSFSSSTVKKFDNGGNYIAELAYGTDSVGFAIGHDGKVYSIDQTGGGVRVQDFNGLNELVGLNFAGSAKSLADYSDIAIDPRGAFYLYAATSENGFIARFTPQGGFVNDFNTSNGDVSRSLRHLRVDSDGSLLMINGSSNSSGDYLDRRDSTTGLLITRFLLPAGTSRFSFGGEGDVLLITANSARKLIRIPSSMSSSVEGLECGTDYVYRAYAENTEGSVGYGASVPFTTTECAEPEERPFITTWKTDNSGGNPNELTIPTDNTYNYDYSVDWGDGQGTSGHTSDATHVYAEPGVYTVKISGSFPYFAVRNLPEVRHKLLTVEQWGNGVWQSMQSAFAGADNLTIPATDAPNLREVTDMSSMFFNASSFDSDINHWDVSHVTRMNNMFSGATMFNQPLDQWDTRSVTDMMQLFWNAASFNQPLNTWNTSAVTTMHNTFAAAVSFNQPLDQWDTGKVTIFNGMFAMTRAFNQPIGVWNTASATAMQGMFSDARAFNQSLSGWDVSHVTSMDMMFAGADRFDQSLASWNIGAASSMATMFNGNDIQNPFGALPPPYPQVLYASGVSTANYDATLTAWSQRSLNNNVQFDAGRSKYCHSEAERQRIIDDFGWTITDSGIDCAASQLQITTPSLPDITLGSVLGSESYRQVIDLAGRSSWDDYCGLDAALTNTNLPGNFRAVVDHNCQFLLLGSSDTLEPQVYSLTLTVTDPDTGENDSRNYSFTVHPAPASQPFATTYAPVISITSVTQNAHKVTIKGTGPKRDSKRVEVFANDTLLGETGLNSSGEWQLVVTDFTPGSYSITAKWSADDAAVGFVPMMNLNQAQNPHEIISKISIVDMSDGATLKELFMPEGYAAISVSPAHNGKAYILAMNMNISTSQGTDKVSVIEYDLATGRLVKLFEARAPDSYAQMRINPAGDALYLLTATDLSVYSFGGIRQQRIPVSMAAGGTITAAALFYRDMVVSEDGKTILLTTWFSYGVDNVTTHIFNLENGTHSTRSDTGLTGGSKEQMTNSFTVGAKAYIVYSGGAVQELNTATGEVLNTYDLGLSDDSGAGGYESVLSAAYSSQHKSLIASVVIVDNGSPRSYHYQIREINVETGVVEVFSVPVGSWRILAQSPNNKSLFFLPSSMAVNDMSTEFSKKVHTFDLQNRVFTESAFDLDGIVLPYSTSPQMLLSNAVFTGTANATVVPYAVTPPTNPGTPTNPGGTDTSSEGPGQSVSVIGGSQGTIVPNQPAPQQSELIPEVAQTFVQKQREKFGIAERSRDRQDHGLVAGIARVLGVAPVTVVRVFPWFILLSLIILLIIALIQLLQRILFARKMKRMVARQELLNHEKKSLLSLASHYLRTPLTLVSAGVDLLPQESTARKNISSASTSLAEVVQRIIESIATDNDLSAITKPIQTQYQRTSLMRPRILIPALLSMSLIAAVNIVAVYGVNLSPGFAHIAAQVVAWCALVGGLYVLYDARDQQKEVHRYHQQLLAHEESLDRARNNFVQSVSEDLTPAVMAVDSAIPLGLPDETTRYLKEGLRQLESLLQNFLLIGQLEQRALKQRARSVSLKSSINAAKDASAHPDVMVRSRVDATSSVEQPESLLRRVFGSLIDNAAEHSPDDQLIEVVSENTKHGVEVAFKDRGEGIAPEKLSLLFKPLSRVESAEDFTHQGMGFSLYVNRLIMHYLGGEISAQSKVGQGTTVKVKVPTQFSAAG